MSNLDPRPDTVELRASVVSAVDVIEARKEPLREKLVMWWNFVTRTHEEIVAARSAWGNGDFGEVRGYAGDPLAAPPLPPGELKARGNRSS
jgi:hypothetical protein